MSRETKTEPLFKSGQLVRVLGNNWGGKQGIIISGTDRLKSSCYTDWFYTVRLVKEGFCVNIDEENLTPSKTDDELFILNLYRRYMWIRFEALSEASEVIKSSKNLEEASQKINCHISSHLLRAVRNPLDIMNIMSGQKQIK